MFRNNEGISTTRRGAGFSIMLLHLIKNDMADGKVKIFFLKILLKSIFFLFQPLFKKVMNELLTISSSQDKTKILNKDSLETSLLHYLCVLVKDSSLSEEIMPYLEQILELTFDKINSKEWTTRNAALQLFGSIVPKLTKQKQFFDGEKDDWEPILVTIDDILVKMPKFGIFILNHLESSQNYSTSSLILFLEFLSKIEVRKSFVNHKEIIEKFNTVFWNLLSHCDDQVRKLSAKCFALFHEFRVELKNLIEICVSLIFQIKEINFQHGLILTVFYMLKKFLADSKFMEFNEKFYLEKIRNVFRENFISPEKENSFYLRCYLIDLLILLEFKVDDEIFIEIVFCRKNFMIKELGLLDAEKRFNFGYEMWKCKVLKLYESEVN